MLHFLISAARAIVEMLMLCLLAQGVLYLIAGSHRAKNPVYRFFALITRGPQQCVSRMLPVSRRVGVLPGLTFMLMLFLWLGLAVLRKLL